MIAYIFFTILLLLSINCLAQSSADIQKLSSDFFEWRRITQPAAEDDIPRVERPEGWIPDFSPEALKEINKSILNFQPAEKSSDTNLVAI